MTGGISMEDCPSAAARPVGPAKLLVVVAAALVDPDGRVLIAQRPEHKNMGGLWEFPGGKLEAGETPEAALVRELRRGARRLHGGELPGPGDLRQPRL